jgi:transcriptional regulator with XRE-family HTH domain
MKTIGDQVAEYRRAKQLSTAELARQVGKKRQHIEQLEAAGNRIPKYLGDLAAVMGTTVDDMLTTAGLAKPRPKSTALVAAEPKGAFINALSTEERELIDHWRHLLGTDRRAKLKEISRLAKEREAQRAELLAEAGFTAIAERAANAVRSRTSTTSAEVGDRLRQGELPLDKP